MDLITIPPGLLSRCMRAIGGPQRGLADALGISTRTLSRWFGGAGSPSPQQFHSLARAVFSRDPALAAEVAALAGATLEALGLGVRALPSPVPAPATAGMPIASGASVALLDSIVCAGADQNGYPTGHVRAIVAAVFARAQELGLTTEAVVNGFAAARAAKKT